MAGGGAPETDRNRRRHESAARGHLLPFIDQFEPRGKCIKQPKGLGLYDDRLAISELQPVWPEESGWDQLFRKRNASIITVLGSLQLPR